MLDVIWIIGQIRIIYDNAAGTVWEYNLHIVKSADWDQSLALIGPDLVCCQPKWLNLT